MYASLMSICAVTVGIFHSDELTDQHRHPWSPAAKNMVRISIEGNPFTMKNAGANMLS